MRPRIFFSYSHADSDMVGPVVALLRASEAFVFRDVDSIKPGKRWRTEVHAAIASSEKVIVFWCEHAEASQEVAAEFQAAIKQGKEVLPLLIDATPLPDDLKEYQYIDFQKAFSSAHRGVRDASKHASRYDEEPTCAPAPLRFSHRSFWGVAGVGALLIAMVPMLMLNAPSSSDRGDNQVSIDGVVRQPEPSAGASQPTPSIPAASSPREKPGYIEDFNESLTPIALVLVAVASLLALLASVGRVVRRRRSKLDAVAIAGSIEREIVQRWGSYQE